MGRSPCCSKVGLRRGPWSSKEDALLCSYVHQNGEGAWRSLPKSAGLSRCGKSCRLRWMNYLRPGIKRGNIDADEEDLIVRMHALLGNRWSLIAGRLPGRTDNEIKNHWNTRLLKKLQAAGVRPQKPEKGPDEEVKIERGKVKACLPKPIRVSSGFSTAESGGSQVSGESSGGTPGWPAMFELGEEGYGGYVDDLVQHRPEWFSGDATMLEQVYEEYLQLL